MKSEITETQSTGAPMTGEPDAENYRVFLLAIIAQCVDDARRHMAGEPCVAEQGETSAGPEAVQWLHSADLDAICEWCDLSPEAVRRAVLQSYDYVWSWQIN